MKRIFVGGLPDDITAEQVTERFSKYGKLSSVQLAKSSIDPEESRGFAHLTMELDTAGWNRLRSTFNGSLWKGKRVRIEDAHIDYKAKMELERQQSDQLEEEAKKQLVKSARKSLCRHATDMSLVNEDNVTDRKKRGWIRGKFGRPLAVLRLRVPGGHIQTVDPAHHKESYQRFYFGDKTVSVSRLHWSMDAFGELKGTDQDKEAHSVAVEEGSYVDDSPKSLKNDGRSKTALSVNQTITTAPDDEATSLRTIFTQPRDNSQSFCLFPTDHSSTDDVIRDADLPLLKRSKFCFQNVPFFVGLPRESELFLRSRSEEQIHLKWQENKEYLYEQIRSTHNNAKRMFIRKSGKEGPN